VVSSSCMDRWASTDLILDVEHERLDGIRDRHQNDLETLIRKLADAQEARPVDPEKVASLERKIKRKRKEVTKATEDLEAHDSKVKAPKGEPSSKNRLNSQTPTAVQPTTGTKHAISGPKRTTTGFSVQSGPVSRRWWSIGVSFCIYIYSCEDGAR